MLLGIEIGGTKLQLGVGLGDGRIVAIERARIDPALGAEGILEQIRSIGKPLVERFAVTRIGVGFGGPVLAATGCVARSHQIAGWEGFPLAAWCREELGVEATLGNDCDAAALAEARWGAGRDCRTVFYVTVGTGIGGGCVIENQLHGAGRPAVAEIGHMRPGVEAMSAEQTVESIASGRGIAAGLRRRIQADRQSDDALALLGRCDGDLASLTARNAAELVAQGNGMAKAALEEALRTLGWAIAQMVTLLAPDVVVVGGGVSLIGESDFFEPLRGHVERFVFPQLKGAYAIRPAALGEDVVVHGALALAAEGA